MTSLLTIWLILVAFLHGANFSATNNPRAYKAVCYDYVGCFNNLPPFDNAHMNLPQSPNQLDTQFLLFTRRNPQNPDYLNYMFSTSIINSHYQTPSATKIIIHGFSNSMITPWIHAMKDAFLKKGNFNVVIVAWGKGAAPPGYSKAVSNTRMVGTQLRLIIDKMVQAGGRLTDIHIIGHSLGAHTAASTGRQLQGKVGRITGLDPAEPEFENHAPSIRLDPSDAAFVDVIHTNGALADRLGAGFMQVSGHVDFYVNGGQKQPGCPDPVIGAIHSLLNHNASGVLQSASCSHGRAHVYFTESILSRCSFTAFPCESYEKFRKGGCRTCGIHGCSQMGLNSEKYPGRGKLYLNTQSQLSGPFCGYQYVVTTVVGTNETVGQLFLTVYGGTETTYPTAITDYEEFFKSGSHITRVTVFPSRLQDITSVDVLYKKKRGFLFGWSKVKDHAILTSVSIEEIPSNERFTFCLRGQALTDGIPATNIKRSASSTC